jgi:hypothetical protein
MVINYRKLFEEYPINYYLLSINIVFYRIDAFLNTLYDFVILLMGNLLYLALSKEYLPVSVDVSLMYIIMISLQMHYLYAGVYLINDYFDFDKVIRYPPDKLSFYISRPVIYFNKKIVAVGLGSLYTLLGLIITLSLQLPAIMYIAVVPIFWILSFFRSISHRKFFKHFVFFCLRLLKYSYAIFTLHILLFHIFNLESFWEFLMYILLPYAAGRTVEYMILSRDLLIRDIFNSRMKRNIIIVYLFGFATLIWCLIESNANWLRKILIIYVLWLIPVVIVYIFLNRLLIKLFFHGAINNYYKLVLKRLLDALLALLLSATCLVVLLVLYSR